MNIFDIPIISKLWLKHLISKFNYKVELTSEDHYDHIVISTYVLTGKRKWLTEEINAFVNFGMLGKFNKWHILTTQSNKTWITKFEYT